MNTVNIENEIQVVRIRANNYPDGIGGAHQQIQAMVPPDGQRHYFGISHPDQNGQIVYWAAAQEMSRGELKYTGIPSFTIPAGRYYEIEVKDYLSNPRKIENAFKQILLSDNIDPLGFCLEWYYGEKCVKCMVRIKD